MTNTIKHTNFNTNFYKIVIICFIVCNVVTLLLVFGFTLLIFFTIHISIFLNKKHFTLAQIYL